MLKTCLKCHTTAEPLKSAAASGWLELAGWLLFLPLAFFFSWWLLLFPVLLSIGRMLAKPYSCRKCGSTELVPHDSPAAQKLQGP